MQTPISGQEKATQHSKSRKDITGQVYGQLTVIKWLGFVHAGTQGKRRSLWECRCICGTIKAFIQAELTTSVRVRCSATCIARPVLLRKRPVKRLNIKTHEERKATMRKGYAKNRDARLAYSRKYRSENPELVKANLKKWRDANPDYKRNKWATDIEYRLKEILRSRLYKGVRGYVKSKNTMWLIGCTIDELKEHLERKFQPGMSWDNYGEWHIDHQKPVLLFDMMDQREQQECFHYTNLQPLWAEDNFKKGTKYERIE